MIEGDPTQIQQVLINLVRNAFDAMRETLPSHRIVQIATNFNGDGVMGLITAESGPDPRSLPIAPKSCQPGTVLRKA